MNMSVTPGLLNRDAKEPDGVAVRLRWRRKHRYLVTICLEYGSAVHMDCLSLIK